MKIFIGQKKPDSVIDGDECLLNVETETRICNMLVEADRELKDETDGRNGSILIRQSCDSCDVLSVNIIPSHRTASD